MVGKHVFNSSSTTSAPRCIYCGVAEYDAGFSFCPSAPYSHIARIDQLEHENNMANNRIAALESKYAELLGAIPRKFIDAVIDASEYLTEVPDDRYQSPFDYQRKGEVIHILNESCKKLRSLLTDGDNEHWVDQSLLERVESLEQRIGPYDKRKVTCRVLEDVQNRAYRYDALGDVGMSLAQFTDWIRGLYPEYYALLTDNETKQ